MHLRPRLAALFLLAVTSLPNLANAQSNIVLRLCEVKAPGEIYCHATSMLGVPVRTDVLSTPAGPFYYVYLCGLGYGQDPFPENTPGTGIRTIAGIECGIDYAGGFDGDGGASPICIFNWVLNGDLQFSSGGWPAPGSGNLITWTQDHCQSFRTEGVTVAIAGAFYLGAYAPAQIRVIPRPVSGYAKLARCDASEVDITPPLNNCGLGMVGFQMPGHNGLCSVAVLPSTWGRIKSQLGR